MALFCHSCGSESNKGSDCIGVIKKVQIGVTYKSTADHLRMTLKSPSGTTSVLQSLTSRDVNTNGDSRTQTLTSVHFWDEVGHGLWVFKLDSNGNDIFFLQDINIFYMLL